VRHGQTDWNLQGRIQGHQPIPLNAVGRQQASDLGRYFANKLFTALYTSDLPRAVETAAILGQSLGLAAQSVSALRERALGQFEGKSVAEFRALRAAQGTKGNSGGTSGGGDLADWSGIAEVESDDALWGRAENALRDIATRHSGPGLHGQGEDILVVTHGGLLSQVIWNTLGIMPGHPRRFPLSNGIVVVLTWEGEAFRMLSLIDLPLLHDHILIPDTASAPATPTGKVG